MSASPAPSQVRRSVPASPRAASPAEQPAARTVRQAPAFAFADSDLDDRIRVNLGDVPGMPKGVAAMDVEGFKPSLLSRLFERFGSKG